MATQSTPPNTVLIGLALFLTFFVMQPTLDQAWTAGVAPMIAGQVGEMEGMRLAVAPFHQFHDRQPAPGRPAVLPGPGAPAALPATPDEAPWRALVPAFLVGELRRAFEMGFLLFLPFLVIDMVVASVLMSLGMMMLPPERGVAAVQADLLRAGGRLAAGGGQPGEKLYRGIGLCRCSLWTGRHSS